MIKLEEIINILQCTKEHALYVQEVGKRLKIEGKYFI